jgi:hypothetical protein
MAESYESRIETSLRRGEAVALATVLTGPTAGRRLLIWAAGHTFGDLGWPRLNQRVALYAEQLLERGTRPSAAKKFDLPGAGSVEVSLEFRLP